MAGTKAIWKAKKELRLMSGPGARPSLWEEEGQTSRGDKCACYKDLEETRNANKYT